LTEVSANVSPAGRGPVGTVYGLAARGSHGVCTLAREPMRAAGLRAQSRQEFSAVTRCISLPMSDMR
jgi:hypothetical protein